MATIATPQKQGRSGRKTIVIGVLVALALLVGAAALMMARMSAVPADLNYATTQQTENGLYRVSYNVPAEQPPLNQIHSWTLHVETVDGQPVENAQIRVDGDMPQHGHGLPTRPQVTRYLGNGDYAVEGVRFQMGGWWVMDFEITGADGQQDTVRFNLLLK